MFRIPRFRIPAYANMPLSPDISVTRLMLNYAGRYRVRFGIAIASVLTGEILLSGSPYIVKLIMDALAHPSFTFASVLGYMVLYGVIMIFGPIFYRVSGVIGIATFPMIKRDIRVDLFSYLHRQSHRYFSNHFGGALTNKITVAGSRSTDLLWLVIWDLNPHALSVVVSLTLLGIANWTIALVTIILITVFSIALFPFFKQARVYNVETSNARSYSTGKIADVITNIWNLQSYARSQFEEQHLAEVFEEEAQKHQTSWFYMEMIRTAQYSLTGVFVVGVSTATLYLYSKHLVTIGDVTLVFLIVSTILSDVRYVLQRLLDFNEQKSDLQDALSTIVVPHEIEDRSDAKQLIADKGKIEFKKVVFAYDDRGNVFDGLTVTIHAWERIGLVGVSGSGKSSIVSLLGRFYDIQGGAIEIDGQDIRTVTQESLREAIAIVPQDPVLFHRSLASNIAYGKEWASQEEIERASALAHAHEFVSTLPEWYESKVGERGVKLSGGQRQRIAIARAILKNASILILDEATSALDSENEELIQDALQKVMEGKTVIAVAHRLSTLKNMDRIIVLEKGKILEDGSHAELIERDGIYANLFNKQVQGFIV